MKTELKERKAKIVRGPSKMDTWFEDPRVRMIASKFQQNLHFNRAKIGKNQQRQQWI